VAGFPAYPRCQKNPLDASSERYELVERMAKEVDDGNRPDEKPELGKTNRPEKIRNRHCGLHHAAVIS